jgi:methylmalonyl-CoA carboxyltransferase small subunit
LKLQITIEGKTYEVEVELLEDEASPHQPSYEPYIPVPATLQTVAEADARAQSEEAEDAADQEKLCCSPINGLVIRVIVEPGQQLEANDLIVVLEAMKMETNVTAPRAGTVKAVCVAPGDPVKLNQVIVEFE